MEEKKDYSLLRPFDLGAFKEGEKALFIIGTYRPEVRRYVAGPDSSLGICVSNEDGSFQVVSADTLAHYRMEPLAWVKGKPVYKGDVLYQPDFKFEHPQGVVITGVHANGNLSWKDKISGRVSIDGYSDGWSWTPPKVEKVKKYGWINIYPDRLVGNIYYTKKMAQDDAAKDVIDTIRISWKE